MMRPYLKYIIPLLIPMLVLMLPATAFPFEGLTVIQQRVIAIFLLAALLWVFEPIPIFHVGGDHCARSADAFR